MVLFVGVKPRERVGTQHALTHGGVEHLVELPLLII